MTAQAGEKLLYESNEYFIHTEPLYEFLELLRYRQPFQPPSTACWRGYFGSWEIRDGKLYLIGLKGYIENYVVVGIEHLFPKQKEVFAEWYSGEIRIPLGDMLKYVHAGFASIYEEDFYIKFKNGIQIGTRLEKNTYVPKEDDPDLPF
jgi:hypothetical protein